LTFGVVAAGDAVEFADAAAVPLSFESTLCRVTVINDMALRIVGILSVGSVMTGVADATGDDVEIGDDTGVIIIWRGSSNEFDRR
jgi:hypothetical protein